MDREVEQLLEALALPDVRTICLEDVETEQLRTVRSQRTQVEYCWTLTSFTFDIVLQRAPQALRVTYVDADVWLAADPKPIFLAFEHSRAAVQITEHAYSPEHDQTATSGKYCVQFLTMDRHHSQVVRQLWQNQCLDWCYARAENGKFGDQKYLDKWPESFGALVHVAQPRNWFQGPWNATRYPYSEAILYHFHGLRLLANNRVRLAPKQYGLPRPHQREIYDPYLSDLASAVCLISVETGNSPRPQIDNSRPALYRRISARLQPWRVLHSEVIATLQP